MNEQDRDNRSMADTPDGVDQGVSGSAEAPDPDRVVPRDQVAPFLEGLGLFERRLTARQWAAIGHQTLLVELGCFPATSLRQLCEGLEAPSNAQGPDD